MSDFDSVFNTPDSADKGGAGVSLKRKATEQGERESLRVYETMPAQLLNGYGMAAFWTMNPEKVWEEFNKPLKTGAKYMTELCSAEPERRGVGINRFLQVLVEYLKYQKSENMRKQNEIILKDDIYAQLYKEIETIYESATYCLAGKKAYTKSGGHSLRSSVSFEQPEAKKKLAELKTHAERLYRWMILPKSRLRMIMGWQAGGGLPYVSGTHLFGMRCFVSYGNACHNHTEKTVCLEEFQDAVCKRHEMELQGHTYLNSEENPFM